MAFVDEHGAAVRCSLASAAVREIERAAPVRSFPSYRGQRNYPGLYYAVTLGDHMGI